MKPTLPGLHHVTAITGHAQKNHDFYTQTLGLRMVKLTVNFDDPSSYHLYYGDGLGSPGTIMTFFAGEGGYPGRSGAGQATVTTFAVPPGALGYWKDRLEKSGISVQQTTRWGENQLHFQDPDGLGLAFVEEDVAAVTGGDYAIRGFAGVTLAVSDPGSTQALLSGTLGFRLQEAEENRWLYRAEGSGFASRLELVAHQGASGRMGSGTIHHVAWRTPDDPQQSLWLKTLETQGYRVSPIMDRNYFHSIYFREPGGVLFEIATDPPGFTVDQPLEELGRKLILPSWLEPQREKIQRALPPLKLPQEVA